MISITSRLLISLSLILAAFLGVTGYTLDKAFQNSTQDATQDRLQGYAMALIAAAEVRFNGSIDIPDILPIVRFNQINSGLYAQVFDYQGKLLWQSTSSNEKELPSPSQLQNTEANFQLVQSPTSENLFRYSYGVSWDVSTKARVYTINILESLDSFHMETDRFRQKLWTWLGGVSILLLVVQGSLMRWSLRPLRKAANEIENIETGQQSELQSRYPKELRALTKNLNALIKSNKQHLQRYRNAASDLAHSLKTPLALLRSAGESNDPKFPLDKVVAEQVEQMNQIVEYQLQRASTSGQNPLSKPLNLSEIVNKVNSGLLKVYADKNISSTIQVNPEILFYGDESDLFELLGNTMDNAFKWAKSKVSVSIEADKNDAQFLTIEISDDGPGIDEKLANRVLERGIRSDERGGTGIGLAIVNDIVQAYSGTISIGKSDLGGCQFSIQLSQNQ